MSNEETPRVSLIIPVFNEATRIADSLYEIKDFLDKQDYNSEIIIIDDGSSDLTTEVIRVIDYYCEDFKSQSSCIIQENIKNVGKGYSIAKGLLTASGQYIVFTDADSSTPISQLPDLLEKLHEGFDVVVGSRNMKGSIVLGRTALRRFLSLSFHLLTRIFCLSSLTDTQCGFKAYRREVAREIADHQRTYGFCFDLEHLYIARKLGYKLTEVPVVWTDSPGSTLSIIHDSLAMFFDIFRISWSHRNLKAE